VKNRKKEIKGTEEGELSKYKINKNEEKIEGSKREQTRGGIAPAVPSLDWPAMRACELSTLLR
jgi:hypothetical protein